MQLIILFCVLKTIIFQRIKVHGKTFKSTATTTSSTTFTEKPTTILTVSQKIATQIVTTPFLYNQFNNNNNAEITEQLQL
jgi:hypothetical protein